MSRLCHLVVIKRSGIDGTHFPLRRETCLFGRGTECDIRIQLPVVSKQHCKVEITEQEVVLTNFSSTSPTQLNGAAVCEPVKLKHGDIITIIDRSFRFEYESHQKGITTIEFPDRRSDKELLRRLSRSSLSHDPDGKDKDPSAHSKFTEENISGRSPVPLRNIREDDRVSDGSQNRVTRRTPQAAHRDGSHPRYPECPEKDRAATNPTPGDLKGNISRVTLTSCNQELESVHAGQHLENSEKNESPFRKLYGLMKEEFDVKLQKENVALIHRKSGTPTSVSGKESALHGERPKSNQKSGRRSQKANPALYERETTQMEEKGTNVEPGQISREAQNSSVPLAEMMKMETPVQYSQPQNSSRKRKSEELSITRGRLSVNFEKNEGSGAKSLTLIPSKLLSREQTPVKVAGADDSGNTPKKPSSRKKASIPSCAEVLPHSSEAQLQGQTSLTEFLAQVERKMQNDTLGKPRNLNAKAGQMCTDSPSSSSLDISGCDDSISDSIDKNGELSLKRRRVSFGGRLKPELFDENLPPNTPLKRGEIPGKRKSLGTHAPAVLKKIIKVQPQTPGKEESSEIHLEVTSAPHMFLSSSAFTSKTVLPAASDQSPASPKASPISRGRSPPQRKTPKKGGRKSGNLSLKRRSFDKSKHDTLQMIYSKRQSGASEANLIVARSWADVVKLGAKKPQTKVERHGHQRRIKRKQRTNTPKKPTNDIQNQFSTGHANSPCTIVIGKARIKKVNVPPWPYRMPNTFVWNKRDCNEDFSGLTEMFKTPAKEKPQEININPDTVANSKILLEEEFQVTNSGEEPLLCTSENFEENLLPSTQNVAQEPSDKSSASSLMKIPEAHTMTSIEVKTPESETEPLKVLSADRFRRSAELGNIQVLRIEMNNEKDIAEFNVGIKTPRKTPAKEWHLEGEIKKSERPGETSKKNAESKDSSEKAVVVTRSRRTLEQKCVPEDSIPVQRLPTSSKKTEQIEESMGMPKQPAELITHDDVDIKLQKTPRQSKVEPVRSSAGTHRLESTPETKAEPVEDHTPTREVLQTPEQTEGTIKYDGVTKDPYKSPQQKAEPIDTPTGLERLFKTPEKGKLVEKSLAFRKLMETAEEAKEPISDNKGLKTVKKTPEQKREPEGNLTDSRRLLKSPKEKSHPVEGLVIAEGHPQTPPAAAQPAGGDSVHRRLRSTPKHQQGLGEHPVLLRRLVRTSEGKADPVQELAHIGESLPASKPPEEQNPRKFRDTPKQKRESAGSPMDFKKWLQTPKIKPEPVGDLRTSLKHKEGPADTPRILTKVLGTPIVTLETTGDLDGATASPQAPKQSKEPMSSDQVQRKLNYTPKHEPEPVESQTGLKRLLRTPRVKPESAGDLIGVKMLLQASKEPEEPINRDSTNRRARNTPQPKQEPVEHLAVLGRLLATPKENTGSVVEDLQTPKQTMCPDNESSKNSLSPRRKRGKSENLTGLQILFRTPEEKADPAGSLAGPEGSETLQQTVDPGDRTISKLKRASREKGESAEDLIDISKLLRTSLRKTELVPVLSGLKRPQQSPEAKGNQTEGLTRVSSLTGTPKRRWESIENLTSVKRFMKTPTKVYSTEDLTLPMTTPSKAVEDASGIPTVLKTYAKERLGTDSNIEKLQEIPLPKTPEITDVKNTTQETQGMGATVEYPQSIHAFQSKQNVVDDLTGPSGTSKEHPEPKITSESLKPVKKRKSTIEGFLGIQRLMAEPKQKTPCLEIDYTGLQEMFDLGNKNQDRPGELSHRNSSRNPPNSESKTGASKSEDLLPEKLQGRTVSQRARYVLRKKSARKSPESEHLPSQAEHMLAKTNVKAELHLHKKPSQGMSLRSKPRYKTDAELQEPQLLVSEKIEINKSEKTTKHFQEENSEDGVMKEKTVTLRSRGKSKHGIHLQESGCLASITENNDKLMKSLQEKVKSTNEEMFLRSKRIKANYEEKTHPKTVMFMNNVQEKNLEGMEINQDKVFSSRRQSKKGMKLEGSNPPSNETKVADEEAEDKIDSSAVKVLTSAVRTQGTTTSRTSRSRSKNYINSEVFPCLPVITKIPPTEEVEEPIRKTRRNVKDTARETPGSSLRFRGSSKVFPTDLLSGTTNRMPVSKDEEKPEENLKEKKVRSSRSGTGQTCPDPQSSFSTSEVTGFEEFEKPARKTLDRPKERATKPEATSVRTRYQTKFLEGEVQHSNSLPIIFEKTPTEDSDKERRRAKHKAQTQDGRSMRAKSKASTDSEGLLSISSITETPHVEEMAECPGKSQEQQGTAANKEVRLRSSNRSRHHLTAKVQESLRDRAEHPSWEKENAVGLRPSRFRKTNAATLPSEIIQMGEAKENPVKKIWATKPEDPEATINQLCLRSRKVKVSVTETANKGITLKNSLVSKVDTSPKGPRHSQRATRSAKRGVAVEAVAPNPKQEKNSIQTKKRKTGKDIEDV